MQRDSFSRPRDRNEILLLAPSVGVSLRPSFEGLPFGTHLHRLNAIAKWKSVAKGPAQVLEVEMNVVPSNFR